MTEPPGDGGWFSRIANWCAAIIFAVVMARFAVDTLGDPETLASLRQLMEFLPAVFDAN